MTDADRFAWLSSIKCNSFSLSRNDDHACNYVTATEWIEAHSPEWFVDTPEDEIQRMKATDTIWELRVYKYTPIGSYRWYGATAAYVVDKAMAAWGVL